MKPDQIRILVADGDEASAAKCVETLTGRGFRVESANTPEDAVGKSLESTYHVVVSDINFPDQASGLELIRKIRSKHRQTCAIALSTTPSLEGAVEAIRLGVCDYLPKPIEGDKLLEAVKRSLSCRGIYLTSEETINKAIGTRLRQLRREQGLTTQQLANRVGVTQSQISQVETGRSAASVVTLYKIAQAFEMSLSEMLEGV
jgi:DNA-binding NtrC family response regulator